MSDAEWDADDFEPKLTVVKPHVAGKWEGEEDDDDVKDNWDDDDNQDDKKETIKSEVPVIQVKKKKTLKEKIAEKEELKRKELERKMEKKRLEEEQKGMTPQQLMEEKIRLRKLQEQADVDIALQALGLDKSLQKTGEIECFEPSTNEDFDKFASLLKNKITKYEKSPNYCLFLENMFRDLVLGLEAESIKKLSSNLTALYNEKLKQTKPKSKKKATKVSLKVGKNDDMDNNNDDVYEDYDDFM